jgi:hypothetical protein
MGFCWRTERDAHDVPVEERAVVPPGMLDSEKHHPRVEDDRALCIQADGVQVGKTCPREYDELFRRDHEEEEFIGSRR